MNPDYFTSTEKQICHKDGWCYYIRDADPGLLEFGYREFDNKSKKYVSKGEPFLITTSSLEYIINALKEFNNGKVLS